MSGPERFLLVSTNPLLLCHKQELFSGHVAGQGQATEDSDILDRAQAVRQGHNAAA